MSSGRFIFEQWTLDCGRVSLTGADGEIALRPKTFEVLRFLVENAGRLVARDEVIDAVWRNVTVTEESLTQCVSEIRHVLGDADQRIIKTMPRRGYLFAVPVTRDARADGDVDLTAHPANNQPSSATGPTLVTPSRRTLLEPAIAVLPFANLSGDAAQEYLSDGFTRLDPFHPPSVYAIQGRALLELRRYRDAVAPLKECIRRDPRGLLGYVWLAATLVRLGEGEEAKAVPAEALRRWPRAATRWLPLLPFRNPQNAEHVHAALREAGFL
jgi:DNA-binding winged helix-turn-helix (wHTH) protein